MTNIYQINDTTQATIGQTPNRVRSTAGTGGFSALLNNALDQAGSNEAAGGISALQEISAPVLDLQTPTSIVTGKTDELLGMLDDYAAQLGDPEVSLKSIAPVVEQLNSEAKDLMKEARFLDTEDSALKEIATQTAVAAQTEYLKFQRGDYLS